MKLTLCDTVGFGDQVNKEDSFGPVVDYVDNQFEAYLQGKLLFMQFWDNLNLHLLFVLQYIPCYFLTLMRKLISFTIEELKIKRNLSGFHDSRVHACLYFITPNGHGLKSIDLVCMKKLDAKVNIIPIIAKADTINKTELTNFKVWLILIDNSFKIGRWFVTLPVPIHTIDF